MRFLRDEATRHYRIARKRLAKVKRGQVSAWADSGVWAVQAALDGYRSTGDKAALDEARLGAVGLLAAVDDLLDRHV